MACSYLMKLIPVHLAMLSKPAITLHYTGPVLRGNIWKHLRLSIQTVLLHQFPTMTNPIRVDNFSTQDGSATVVNDLTSEDREFLSRLLRILPRVLESGDDDPKLRDTKSLSGKDDGLQVPDSSVDHPKPTNEVIQNSNGVSSAIPKPVDNTSKILDEFDSKYARVQTKISYLQKALRGIAGGQAALAAANDMSAHLTILKELIRQQLEPLPGGLRASTQGIWAIEQRFGDSLLNSLSSLALSSWALSHDLGDLCDTFMDTDCLEPLDKLAIISETESKELRDVFGTSTSDRRASVQRYILGFAPQLGFMCDEVAASLTKLIETGLPMLIKLQRHEMSRYVSMMLIAMINSVIIAIMLAASVVNRSPSALNNGTSGCLLLSLCFSIASAINTLLGLLWWLSPVSARSQLIPWFITAWFKAGPLVSFFASAGLFSIGLCLFAFSSSQAIATIVLVILFTSLEYASLALLAILFVKELRQVSNWVNIILLNMQSLASRSIHEPAREPAPSPNPSSQDIEQGMRMKQFEEGPIQVSDPEQDDHGRVLSGNLLSGSHLHSFRVTHSQRLSSDSSRSLPPIPQDNEMVRCMQYSPNGMYLCIGNCSPYEPCVIFSADSPSVTLGELQVADIVYQIEWSPNAEYLLLRLKQSVYIWKALPSPTTRKPVVVIRQEVENVKWFPDEEAFLTCRANILSKLDVRGTPLGLSEIPGSRITDFTVTHDGRNVIGLVEDASSGRSTSTLPLPATKQLVDISIPKGVIEQTVMIGWDARSLVCSNTQSMVLVNYIGDTPPQLWHLGPLTTEKRASTTFGLSQKRVINSNAPSSARFSGKGLFGGNDDAFVVALGTDGDTFIFSSVSGELLRHINLPSLHVDGLVYQCLAWDPDILSLAICVNYADGSIWQWKALLENVSQREVYVETVLEDEDSTLIRASDAM